MRGSLRLLITSALLLLATGGVFASECAFPCLDVDFAGRLSGGINPSLTSYADMKLECAVGLPEFSLVAWIGSDSLFREPATFGGTARLMRDWLSVSLTAQQGETGMEFVAACSATPDSWLLAEGIPTLLGGISASAELGLGSTGAIQLVLSPYLTGVIPAGAGTTVLPSMGIDVSLDSETEALGFPASRLISTVNAGSVLIANTVHFDGLFCDFSALVISVSVPELGLAVSGSLLPAGPGSFTYRVGIDFEWGDTYLLPAPSSDKPASTCAGGVCF